jgi:hypothetical protein
MKRSILISLMALVAAVAFGGALTAPRDTRGALVNRVSVPVYANTTIYQGGMIALNSGGYAVEASDAASIAVIGRAAFTVDNTTITGTQSGASGAKNVIVDCGQSFYWNLTDTSTYSNKISIGQLAYVVDDHTVSVSGSGLSHNAIAGVVADWDSVISQIAVTPPASAVAVSGVGAFSSATVTNALTAGSTAVSGLSALTTVTASGTIVGSSTIAATGYKIGTITGKTGIYTNSPVTTNVFMFAGGLLTNITTTAP